MQDVTPQPNSDLSLIEEELQNELKSMFELDTQTYLQTYEKVTQQLKESDWTDNIQELYRSIHTIKGGAVTVGANSVLATTTALEDMLSDLRYLQSAPPLDDGELIHILVEAGEVVSGSLLIGAEEEDGGASALKSALDRLTVLHKQVSDRFLNEIDEHQQLCQDFVNQGFDLMVLELEMALEQDADETAVSPQLVEISAQTFTDLESVGKNLEIGQGWILLLRPLFELLIESDTDLWRSRCSCYLTLLKACALEGGTLTPAAQTQLETDGFPTTVSEAPVDIDMTAVSSEETAKHNALEFLLEDVASPDIVADFPVEDADAFLDAVPDDLNWIIEEPESSDNAPSPVIETPATEAQEQAVHDVLPLDLQPTGLDPAVTSEKEEQLLNPALAQLESISGEPQADSSPEDLVLPEDFLESLAAVTHQSDTPADMPEWLVTTPEETPESIDSTAFPKDTSVSNPKNTIPKIPVPLDRLDRSARALVDILLSARATQGRYQSLQAQVAQIVQLSQENAAYITQLRQMQDDYALLQDLQQKSSDQTGVQLEGYRSGYTAVNRLLENSLRLSEIGAEAAAFAQITKQEFQNLNRNIKTLQSSVEESRLISFKSVAFRLRAITRDLINRIGKPVNLIIEGESQNLDAGTIQVLEPALMHLIRNAYDHGIEPTDKRLAQAKPEIATITLSLKRQGSFYRLSLVDDGGGIDRTQISKIAKNKSLQQFDTSTDEQLLQVISQPGFSSQTTVSEVSGRGVGMDVVNYQVQSVGGSIKLSTQIGQGTQFDIKIPVPHLLVPCIVVKAGLKHLAIPTDAIQTMRLWDQSCVLSERPIHPMMPWEREFEGQREPMMPILNYWQERLQPSDIDPAKMETAVCLRVLTQDQDSENKAMWLVIDDLVEELDLLIAALPHPLKPPTGMMGMSTLPTGDMVPVLEAGAIAQVLLNSDTAIGQVPLLGIDQVPAIATQQAQNTNLILVVDDAALLRRRIEISLVNYGYEVQCCRDGLEAWNWIQENPTPGLMITDIEMPQMDGFTLVDRCRQSGHHFPILVSSSRLSEEWSQEAKRVGANDYLTKGFSTNDLIERVSGLIEKAVINH